VAKPADAAAGDTLAPLPDKVQRIVYLGTPQIAVPPLAALVKGGFDVVAVVTGPDRRRGRGGAVSPTPVKAFAVEAGIDVVHDVTTLPSMDVDLGVVVAFGSILDAHLLARVPMVNLHFSLLPRWRGAAPVERAILAGDEHTGVCVMHVEHGLDTGGVFECVEVPLDDTITASELSQVLAHEGASLLARTLAAPLGSPAAQMGEVSYAHKITTGDCELVWSRGAVDLSRRVRLGRAWTTVGGRRLRVLSARAWPPAGDDPPPGSVLVDRSGGRGVIVGTGHGTLELHEVVPEGRKPQTADSWVRGLFGGGDRGAMRITLGTVDTQASTGE
jgi:methionyl-tRNA formyltransferase